MNMISCKTKNKIDYKRKIFKGTIALLITALLIGSTTVATADADTAPLLIELINEGFEAGHFDINWTTIDTNPFDNWDVQTLYVYEGTYAAGVPYAGGNGPMDEWLITQTFDVSNFDAIELSFWAESWWKSDDQGWTVELYADSDDEFTSEDIIWDFEQDEDSSWGYPEVWMELNFTLDVEDIDSIRIAWRYVDPTGSNGWYFSVDNVYLATPGVVYKTELEIGKIGGLGAISAEINNIGNQTANDIEWTIMIEGGFMGNIQGEASGTIDRLKYAGHRDDSETIMGPSVFGLGKVTVTVEVETEDAKPKKYSRDATGFVILSKFYAFTWLQNHSFIS